MPLTDTSYGSQRRQLDLELVQQASQGDQRAYASLMKAYWTPMYMMMLRITRNTTEADDLTMESFGKAFGSLDTFTPVSSFYTWLFRIGMNTGIDFVRRKRIDQGYIEDLARHFDGEVYEFPIASEDLTPEEDIIRQQRQQRLRVAVQKLDPIYRHIIELRYFEDKPYEEIAQMLGMPIGTVKIRLYRAKSILKTLLDVEN